MNILDHDDKLEKNSNNNSITLNTFITSSCIYDKSKSCDSALEVFLKNKHLYEDVNRFTRYVSTVENYETSDPLEIY